VWLAMSAPGRAATVTEDFSSDPLAHGWQVYGDTNLFRWDSTNKNLAVTWDSSQTNSYFSLPLGTVIGCADTFHLSFDLMFSDYASGTTTNKPYDFEAAIGFLNLAVATQTNFSRGAGKNAIYGPRNLVQFNFFPAFLTYQPTIDQVIIATNYSSWLYNDANLLNLTSNQWFHVDMNYTATNRTLTTTVTNGGVQYGVTQAIVVPTNFDFRCDTVAICSYSDQHATGSILAHGTVDNFSLTVPPPPVQNLTAAIKNKQWTAQFISNTNWLYTLECTTDFVSWNSVSIATNGNGTNLFLADTMAPSGCAFYRIRADRP